MRKTDKEGIVDYDNSIINFSNSTCWIKLHKL